jgi:hypothetical protein
VDGSDSRQDQSSDDAVRAVSDAAFELVLALGFVRTLTLLPLFAPVLSEIEERIARALESVQAARSALASLDEDTQS